MIAAKKADFNSIGKQFGIDPVIARILRNRDLCTMEEMDLFLNGSFEDLHAPELMKNMQMGVQILRDEIGKGTKIRIIGDYDIDGICSTYILYRGLQTCGAKVDYAIPHRMHDGYGINIQMIDKAISDGIELILTCDNGISAKEQIAYANEKGIRTIITDHHEIPFDLENGQKIYKIPDALVVIDPKQEDDSYPYPEICGAFVAYKLIQLLLFSMDVDAHVGDALLEELLEEAALATVGDVMPLRDENHVLVKEGLKRLSTTKNLGLKALLTINDLIGKNITAYHLGFIIGPCLNATGRLDSAERAMDLLCATTWDEAVETANYLKKLNDGRKQMTEQGVKLAIEQIERENMEQQSVLVIYLPECHESIAGIIAGRIKERYYKPTFVLTKSEDGVKGSGRSIEAYHMYEKMNECAELFTKFGGHAMAAGLSTTEEQIEPLRRFLNENANLMPEDFEQKIVIDVAMPMSYCSMDLIHQMSLLEPYGNGNRKPVFAQKNLNFLNGQILGANKNVVKYKVQDEHGLIYEVIYFGDYDKFHQFLDDKYGAESGKRLLGELPRGNELMPVSVLYYPDINEFRGRRSIQFVMQDYC